MSQGERTIGQYRLLEVLGSGGLSTVYVAEHLVSGRRVALKTVDMPSAALLPRIRREIHALGRLHHRCIVQILDSGTHGGLPWYAMELLEGPTLGKFRRSLDPSKPPELTQLLGIVRRLCDAMSYVHGEGVVHGDLKPDNIVIVEAELLPVLVDFGVLSEWPGARSRESLAVDAAGAGTPLYIAPEALRGEMVDARADLYSLGCLLYELLAGHPPFVGSAAEVCEAQLDREPTPLSAHLAWIPPKLDELVLRLLRKERRHRPGYATDVAAALADLGAPDGIEADRPEARSYLYRPGFVGRARTLEALDRAMDLAIRGQWSVVLVAGESGVGKTRLLMELGARARERGMRVLAGECLPPTANPIVGDENESTSGAAVPAGSPLQALSKPLRAIGDWCRQQGRAETARVFSGHGRILACFEPSLLEVPGVQESPEPEELPPEDGRARLFRALTSSLWACAQRKPLFVALDDLQWADELTLGWLESLGLHEPFEAQVIFIGTYRADEASERIRSLTRFSRMVHVDLERLGEEPIGAMVREMLALDKPAQEFVRFLTQRSSGNPFFLGEYLRAAVTEGALYRDELGHWQIAERSDEPATVLVYETLALPRSLKELVAMRLARLTPEARRLVDAGAVLGREMEVSVLLSASFLDEESRTEALDELLRRQVLEEAEPGRVRFVHDQIRETTYGELRKKLRSRLHGAAAAAMEAHHGRHAPEQQAALAMHWEEARSFRRARECYLAAARHAVGIHAHRDAERLFAAYFRVTPQPTAESVTARNELAAQVLHFQGRTAEALSETKRSLDEARSLSHARLEANSLSQLALFFHKMGRIDEAREACVEALTIEHRLGGCESEGRTLRHFGSIEHEQGRPEGALEAYKAALEINRRFHDPQGELSTLMSIANVYTDLGRLDDCAAFHEKSLALARASVPGLEGSVLGNLGNIRTLQGRIEEARDYYQQALAIHRRLGRRASEGVVLSNLANLNRLKGDLQTAEQLFRQALTLDRAVGNRRGESVHLTQFGIALYENGSLEEAQSALQRALETARELGDRRTQAYVLFEESRRKRHLSEPSAAADLLGQAEAIFRDYNDRIGITECVIARGLLELASGRAPHALLDEVRASVAKLGVYPESEVGRSLVALERAVAAFDAGRSLLFGECPEDLSDALRRRLTERFESRESVQP